jgi:hypothetical protein
MPEVTSDEEMPEVTSDEPLVVGDFCLNCLC